MENINKRKYIYLISLAIIFVLFVIVGVTYAFWGVMNTQESTNVVTSGCFDVSFTEESAAINIEKTYPITDMEGKGLTPYTFTVTNTCDMTAAYNVNIEMLSTSTFTPDVIKAVLDTQTPQLLSDYTVTNNSIDGATAFNMYSDTLTEGESATHELRLWIDINGTMENSMNKILETKIVINSTALDMMLISYDKLQEPVLNPGLVPVEISNTGVITIADPSTDWHNYAEKRWANAVVLYDSVVTRTPGTVLSMEDIFQMYVWIPRYNFDDDSIVSPDNAITIEMVNIDETAHPAFTFGETELEGLWIGKFEQGPDNSIKPNQNSINAINIAGYYSNIKSVNSTNGLDATSDIHMMKNTEWGAVAYFSQSIYGVCFSSENCEKVENNNYTHFSGYRNGFGNTTYTLYASVTGCGFGEEMKISDSSDYTDCHIENQWNSWNGMKTSTNRNVTGIYDMAGGKNEIMMTIGSGTHSSLLTDAGFTEENMPENKYLELYEADSSLLNPKRGDAMSTVNGWNSDLYQGYNYWFVRGGSSSSGTSAGIFSSEQLSTGSVSTYVYASSAQRKLNYTSRSILAP